MCSACNNFKLQMPFLSQAMRSFAKWEGDAAANTQVAIPKQDKQALCLLKKIGLKYVGSPCDCFY